MLLFIIACTLDYLKNKEQNKNSPDLNPFSCKEPLGSNKFEGEPFWFITLPCSLFDNMCVCIFLYICVCLCNVTLHFVYYTKIIKKGHEDNT